MSNTRTRRKALLRKKRRKRIIKKTCILGIACLIIMLFIFTINNLAKQNVKVKEPPEFEVDLLTVNEYSRPGFAMNKINGIVIHYTANPGTTAKQNRDYFEGLKDSHQTKASSHFVIGIEGEIIQCIPSREISYASNERNSDTLSIECCHPDETGKFTDKTYNSLVAMCAWLCGEFDIKIDNIIRHYDVTGKNCPKYYVENEREWEKFKKDVGNYIKNNGV